MFTEKQIEYLVFFYCAATDKQRKDAEVKFKVSKRIGKKHKDIAKELPISRERVTEIINYKLPFINRQINNFNSTGTVMFTKPKGGIVYECLPK